MKGKRTFGSMALACLFVLCLVGIFGFLRSAGADAEDRYRERGGYVTFCVTSWEYEGHRAEIHHWYIGSEDQVPISLREEDPCREIRVTRTVTVQMFAPGILAAKVVGADGQEQTLERNTDGRFLFAIIPPGEPPVQSITAQRPHPP